jgi:hypothetical protein
MSEKKEYNRLLQYLNELSQKHNGRDLTDEQLEIFNKRIAEAALLSDIMKYKKHLDPLKNPKEYLELERELNIRLKDIVEIILAAADWAQFEANPDEPMQLPLSEFLETTDFPDKDKLSNIRILKKGRGVNGHS